MQRRILYLMIAPVLIIVIVLWSQNILMFPIEFLGQSDQSAQMLAVTATPQATTTRPAPTATATLLPSPTANPTPTAVPALPARLRAPDFGIDAPVIYLGLNADDTMPSPDGPEAVAWYTFTARPGSEGNAVFAGHVDWHTGVTGVFWRLRELQPGDLIHIESEEGQEYAYSVTTTTLFPADDVPIMDVVGPKAGQWLTLISCEGIFDRTTSDYDHRRVVVATRVN